jgi:2-oxo-4-hydroxy-4-carboxy-5-ureidoimidazoline decarboxylase
MIALQDLNRRDRASFVSALDGIFEHSPWIAEQAWERRPFADLRQLHQTLVEVVQASSEEDKLRLIRAHPDLVGAAARAGTLTRESTTEQARIDDLTPEDIAGFERDNARYWERFGFPFVICVRENKKQAILAGFASRLRHDPATEQRNALDEISKIAWYRLKDRICEPPTHPVDMDYRHG